MLNINKKEDKILNNSLYYATLDCGLKVYVSPQKKFSKTIGMFGTNYGSVDNIFSVNGGESKKVPDGIAHFLEHKLFEQEDANALDLFSQIGMSANAYTSFDHTTYYFETTKNVELGIETLIKLVRTPYFTDENVEKEKGIIKQEINMYEDEPSWQSYMTTIKGLYKNHSINVDIVGTVESIQKINKELLYECYNNFYNLKNMFFIVVGDVEPEKIINLVNEELKKYKENEVNNVEKIYEKEELDVINKEINKKINVYMPTITYGFKFKPLIGRENLKRELIISIIESMYFSKLSSFYNEMYEKGIINIPIDLTYESSRSYAFAVLFVQSLEVDKVKCEIDNYIDSIFSTKFDKILFDIVKREKYGNLIYAYDNIDTYWREVIQLETLDIPAFSVLDILEEITEKDVMDVLAEMFKNNNKVMSIVR